MSKSNKLTPKQEAFAQKYVECGNASEAYRFAYNVGECKDETIWCNACQLLASTKVTQRVDEIRAKLAKRNEVTLDKLNQRNEHIWSVAKCEDDLPAMQKNVESQAKLNGLIVDRSETKVDLGGLIDKKLLNDMLSDTAKKKLNLEGD